MEKCYHFICQFWLWHIHRRLNQQVHNRRKMLTLNKSLWMNFDHFSQIYSKCRNTLSLNPFHKTQLHWRFKHTLNQIWLNLVQILQNPVPDLWIMPWHLLTNLCVANQTLSVVFGIFTEALQQIWLKLNENFGCFRQVL